MPIENAVVVITGGSQGLGWAMTQAFAHRGCVVFVMDVLPLPESHFPNIIFSHCDVSKADNIKACFKRIAALHSHVDILVNNAGIQRYGSITETDEDLWDLVMDVNLKGAFLCAQAAIPIMTKPGGVIINIASAQSHLSQRRVAAYTTSKTALLGLTRSIAIDYAPNIRCVAVCPSTMDTPMLHEAIKSCDNPEDVLAECSAMHLMESIADPRDVAELVLFLCSDQAKFITGQSFRVDGGLGLKIDGSPI